MNRFFFPGNAHLGAALDFTATGLKSFSLGFGGSGPHFQFGAGMINGSQWDIAPYAGVGFATLSLLGSIEKSLPEKHSLKGHIK